MKDNYNQVEDFMSDESFVAWVYKTNEKDVTDWELWMAYNSSKNKLIKDAVSLLSLTAIKETPVSEQQLAAAESKLRSAIKERPAKVIGIRRRIWYWSAASVLIISLAFGLSYLFHAIGGMEKSDKKSRSR